MKRVSANHLIACRQLCECEQHSMKLKVKAGLDKYTKRGKHGRHCYVSPHFTRFFVHSTSRSTTSSMKWSGRARGPDYKRSEHSHSFKHTHKTKHKRYAHVILHSHSIVVAIVSSSIHQCIIIFLLDVMHDVTIRSAEATTNNNNNKSNKEQQQTITLC